MLYLTVACLLGIFLSSAQPALPVLPWAMRSDWQSVASFGAKGDSVTDDTAALQAGLNFVAASRDDASANKTLYFPPGTYLVTSTLLLTFSEGVLLLGTGRTTTLLWGGPSSNTSRMLWSDGNTRFHLEGFVFNGNGKEVVGLDHDSKNQYESRVVHRNIAFFNCSVGIRIGHAEQIASAEMTYENLLFLNNWVGVSIGQSGSWNDFDNSVSS